MNAADFGMITTTVTLREDATRIAALLLSERLAACVQISVTDSHYVWKGETSHASEFLLSIKTRAALFEPAMARIATEHPYETPEIVATVFAAGLPSYFDWIAENTRPV